MEEAPRKPLWKRVVDFPLVAMLLATALYIVALVIGFFLDKLVAIGQPATAAIHAAINIALVLAAYKLVIVRMGRHPRDDLPAQGALRNLGLGLVAGFVIFAAAVVAATIFGVYVITGCCRTTELAKDLIGDALMPGFMEELLFRGILFKWIEEFAGSWIALLLTSALFGFAHILNPNATWFSSFAIAVEAGVLLGGAYMLSRNLWLPMGLHAAWNFTQGFVFDIPVSGLPEHGLVDAKLSGPAILSGGGFGLEASLFTLVVATAFGIWFVVAAVRRGGLVQPMWVRRRRVQGAAS